MLWFKSQSAEAWLYRRTNYSLSLSVMCMAGYILGLGDRHMRCAVGSCAPPPPEGVWAQGEGGKFGWSGVFEDCWYWSRIGIIRGRWPVTWDSCLPPLPPSSLVESEVYKTS